MEPGKKGVRERKKNNGSRRMRHQWSWNSGQHRLGVIAMLKQGSRGGQGSRRKEKDIEGSWDLEKKF